ncbi:MAG: hypothetical protein RIG77_11045 [Cyclobacteriaceae bacterium]
MDRLTNRVIILMLMFGCSQSNQIKVLSINPNFEKKEEAKLNYPGLYFDSDSLVTMIYILNEKRHIIKKIMYEGSVDTLWTRRIMKIKELGSKDTLVKSFVAHPIVPDESRLVLYFMSFGDLDIEVRRNGDFVFKGNVETYKTTVVLKKEDLTKIEVTVDGQPLNLDIHKEYNYIEMIHKDSLIDCNYLYYSRVPLGGVNSASAL